jgi:hypothetical protein
MTVMRSTTDHFAVRVWFGSDRVGVGTYRKNCAIGRVDPFSVPNLALNRWTIPTVPAPGEALADRATTRIELGTAVMPTYPRQSLLRSFI